MFFSSGRKLIPQFWGRQSKARSAVLFSALVIVLGTTKETLSRVRRPGGEGTRRRIGSDRLMGL